MPGLELIPSNRNLWTEAPSTRDSVALHEQFYPINKQLTTAGTAEDLWTISTESPTINLCTNPSFETVDPPTGFTASGAALSRSAAQYLYGSYSILVNPADVIAGEGFYYTIDGLGKDFSVTASVYVRGVAAAGDVRIRIYGVTSGTWLSTGATTNLAADWLSRLTTTYTNPAHGFTEASIRIYVVTVTKHTNDFYCDGMQLELLGAATTYCDGAQGLLYSWDGISHASVSRRRPPLRVIRGFTFNTDRDVYVAYGNDRSVTSSSTVGRLVKSGTDWWNDHPVNIRKNISFINRYTGERPTIQGEIWGI